MYFLRFFFLAILALWSVQVAQAQPVTGYESQGILKSANKGQIAPNIWLGVSRTEAFELIEAIPARMASPIYYDLARKFLLSDAPALASAPNPKKGKDQKAVESDPSNLFLARIDKLLEIGALRDAQSLYDTVITDTPNDFDVAYRSLQMLMLRGQLSAACLDLQAMQHKLGNDARWKDFNRFCRIQFAQGGERQRLLSESKFTAIPKLEKVLRGRGFGKATDLSTDDLAYAVAIGAIGPSSIGLLASKAGAMQPLLLSVLLNIDTPEAMPQKTCLAIEATRRGILSTRDLITLYEKPHYDAALLLDGVGVAISAANIHPCMIPTVMYQRVASNTKTPLRDKSIREALDVMKDLPDAAFWPMAVYFRDFDVKAAANKKYLWRVSRIVAYEKGGLPESWRSGWGGQGGIGVAPFWPIQEVMHTTGNASENLKVWQGQWPSIVKRTRGFDPVLPVLLSAALNGESPVSSEKQKNKRDNYENNFPLTFSRSYSIPSYGLTQRLTDVIEKGQTGQSVALLLIGYGAIPADQVIPHQMALVIGGMNKAGLGRHAQRFAIEVLQ